MLVTMFRYITTKVNAYKEYAPALLRISMALVFLYFGTQQLINTDEFVYYLPLFLQESSYATTLIIANGIFEVIAGTLLLLGLFIRPVAFLLAGHLALITIEMYMAGSAHTAVRDVGLTLATFAVFLWGSDVWSLEEKLWKK
ncbi:MAG: DoxX family protein [Candidatus Woesearchaeota archaeon]